MPAKKNNFEVYLRIYFLHMERFPFNQNFPKFEYSGKWYRKFPEKFPEVPKAVKFPKCQPFNRKF